MISQVAILIQLHSFDWGAFVIVKSHTEDVHAKRSICLGSTITMFARVQTPSLKTTMLIWCMDV
jgi:hypothetical protein